MKQLILTADDFGIAPEVNQAVDIAHRSGVLRAASLMVGASAVADAVARAQALPFLAVGRHVVLVNGRPVLPPERVGGRVLRILGELPDGVTEILFHPAIAAFAGADSGTERYRWREELAALTSPGVRSAIERLGIARVTYGELAA